MKKIKLGIYGASGRVGSELTALIQNSKDFSAAVGIGHRQPPVGFVKNLAKLDKTANNVDVFVDFSLPEAFSDILDFCVSHKIPLVSGTTGLTSQHRAEMQKASRKIPLLWSSNMSLGVATLRKALDVFGQLQGFDFQIEEFHHNRKKDKPSGTALTLQQDLEVIVQKKLPEILSGRGGGIFGVHKIYAMSDEEVIVFEHQALNRTVFARGALHAARWLLNQKPGMYQMTDVLNRNHGNSETASKKNIKK